MKQTSHKLDQFCRKAVLPSSGSPCTGCGLCVSVCTHGAVALAENEDGFLTAKVNTTRCVGCKACEKLCARLADVSGNSEHRFYEAWSLDEAQRKESSSGGVFSELAADCLHRGGVVFGVTMRGGEFPHFVAIDCIEDLKQLRGSKYLQTETGNILSQVAAEVKSNRQVLFAGLSCHIRAARARFGERYPNLLLIDLACFGTPSRHLLRSFAAGLKNQSGIADIKFRDKTQSWRQYGMRIKHADGTDTFLPMEKNIFMKGFLCHLGLNECCYTCRSAIDDRPGDITLGDFWGRPKQDDEHKGVSVVITHTDKGANALEGIRVRLHLTAIEKDTALSCNGGLEAHNGELPPQRSAFLQALHHLPLEKALKLFYNTNGQLRKGFYLGKSFFPYPELLCKAARKIAKAARCVRSIHTQNRSKTLS